MTKTATEIRIRNLEDVDIGGIVRLDEKISGEYRPEVWERRVGYYLRRDPEASVVALSDGEVIGFMLGEVRSGDFGLEEPTGWIEVLGVDPDYRRMSVGQRLAERMIEHFRREGATSVHTLMVDEQQEAGTARFFESIGFAPATLQPYVLKL